MARERTGSLELRSGTWHARLSVRSPNGTSSRPWYSLGTSDRVVSQQRLRKLNQQTLAGISPETAAGVAGGPASVRDYAGPYFDKRDALGKASVHDERQRFKDWIDPHVGDLPLDAVRPLHIRNLLDHAIAEGCKQETVRKIRGVAHRLFKAAWQDELIDNNPVARVQVPALNEVVRERVILTDDEITQYLSCATVDPELRLMSLAARAEGGMRASDINRWDWSMIDRVHFATCFVPRTKTKRPQALEVPEVLRPFLRARWEGVRRPESGPVFPVRVGKRAGDFRKLGSSFAKALRRDLLRARVRRHECTRPPDAPAMKIREACCPNMVHDPIFSDTATTLRVDFHSFRRAFSTALADAGVNAQTAMRLASHADEKTHMRYVMRTAAMRRIPETVVPKIAALPIATGRGNSRVKAIPLSDEILSNSTSAPGRTRTCDPRLRRPLLYPTELRAHGPLRGSAGA
jgi:integrase